MPFKISAWNLYNDTSTHTSFTKASHMTKPQIDGAGKYTIAMEKPPELYSLCNSQRICSKSTNDCHLAHSEALCSGPVLPLWPPLLLPLSWFTPLQPHPLLCFSWHRSVLSWELCTESHSPKYKYSLLSHLIRFSLWLCLLQIPLNTFRYFWTPPHQNWTSRYSLPFHCILLFFIASITLWHYIVCEVCLFRVCLPF